MRLLFASLITLLTVSCTTPTAVGVKDSKPKKNEFGGVVRYEERKVPGAEYIQKASIAYAKYDDLVHQQEERNNPLAQKSDFVMPEEVVEEKKREYLKVAEENIRKVLELNPDSAMAHMVLGIIHLDREEYDEALAQFHEVLRIVPLAENAWHNIAHVHWRRKDAARAKAALAQALRINPENRAALAFRDIIEAQEKRKAAGNGKDDIPPFRPKFDR